ncbi:hypothetical protein G9A89_005800 [Geosiphon pyriformis]|nr:hypothetical protein G9A89_005800 [Geosiphon pyriformis]
MIRKSLKLKTCLFCDFPNTALHHPLLYDLKTFKQVIGWALLNSLQFSVRLHVSLVNNFLAGIVKIFLHNELSLVNNLPNTFRSSGVFSMSMVLGDTLYFSSVHSLKRFGEFSVVQNSLHKIWSSLFDVFTDGSLKNFGSVNVSSDIAVYFPAVDLSLGVRVWGLLSSILAELQAVALALECCPSFCMVVVHTDSQATINACVFEMSAAVPDFHAPCWVKKHHIFNLVYEKNLNVRWIKVKEHSGVCGNEKADAAAEAGAGRDVILSVLIGNVDWEAISKVWDSDLHMLAGSTSRKSSVLHLYLMKACLLCGKVKLSDHAFLCALDVGIQGEILTEASASWISLVGYRADIKRTGLVGDSELVSDFAWCTVQIMSNSIVRMLDIADFLAKKEKNEALENSMSNRKIAAKKLSGYLWSSETDNTTESDNVNIEEECLVKKTSFNYDESGILAEGNLDQMPKNSKILTKRALGKLTS